jgi:hypothetical protein
VGSVLWRLLNAAALLAGFAWWLRAVAPAATSSRRQAVLFLLVLPLSLTSLNNGQCNPLVIGLLLAAMAGAAGQRWNLAAACAALACAFKVYPIAVGLLLAAVYPRRFAARLVVALGVVAVLPFLCQRPEYVAHQYDRWFHKLLSEEGRKAAPFSIAYRDLWLLFRQYAPIEVRTYQALQLLAAASCALVCLAGRRRGWPPRRMLTAVTTQGTCWMMLFGPTTESSSYVMLAPALAWSLGGARLERWPAVARFPPLVSFGLFLIAQLAGLTKVAGAVHALGPQPLGALLLWVSYLMVAGRDLIWPSPPTETVSDPASLPKAA